MWPPPIGILVYLEDEFLGTLQAVAELGLCHCQLGSWQPALWSVRRAEEFRSIADRLGVSVTAFFAGYDGPKVWNPIEGPPTVGLVPAAYRDQRVAQLKRGAQFAARLGAPAVFTHVGFLPDDADDPNFEPTVQAVRELARHAAKLGLGFWFETGQETPAALRRTIQAVGGGNVGVNFDPANLILYGKGEPSQALTILGPFVRGVHAKDAVAPAEPTALGRQTPIGQGQVDFPALLGALRALGYSDSITIERRIRQPADLEEVRGSIASLRAALDAID